MLSDVVIKLDDFDLTKYMDLSESPDFGLLPGVNNETRNRRVIESNFSDRVYPFIFFMSNDDWSTYRDQINLVLPYGKVTKKLTVSVLPDRYWNVSVDGESTYTRSLTDRSEVQVTISFLIPEGFGHATTLTPITATAKDGILSMDIDYDGTVETPLELTIHNNAETGYLSALGMVGDQNTFLTQLGYVDEADGETRTKQATVFAKDGGSFTNWQHATSFYENTDKKIVANLNRYTDWGGWLGGLPSDSKANGGKWYGGADELILPTPAQYCYLWGRAWFEAGRMGQTGQWTLAMIDEDNHVIAAMAFSKSDTVGNNALVYFMVGDGTGKSNIWQAIPFTPSTPTPPNPYSNTSRLKNSNMFDIRKEAGKITFYYYGKYYPINVPELANKKVKRIQFYVGQYVGRSVAQMVTRMMIRDVMVLDLKSQYWADLPNRFTANSDILIGQKEGMHVVYRDGVKNLEDVITGSTFPVLKPGMNHIEFNYSDFTTTAPTITGTYRKRWY